MTVSPIPPLRETAPPPVDRRAAPRHPILRRCLVWPPGASGPEGWQSIAYSVSVTGIAVVLPLPLPVGSVLMVEAWGSPAARPVQARVVRSSPYEYAWFCGCELLTPLNAEDLQAWLSGPPTSLTLTPR